MEQILITIGSVILGMLTAIIFINSPLMELLFILLEVIFKAIAFPFQVGIKIVRLVKLKKPRIT